MAGYPASRSSSSPIAPVRSETPRAKRNRPPPSSMAGSQADHGQPRTAALRKEDQGSTCPMALSILGASARSLASGWTIMQRSANWASTEPCGRSAACWPWRKLRASPGFQVLCAARSCAEAALARIEPVPLHHLSDAAAYLRGERDPGALGRGQRSSTPRLRGGSRGRAGPGTSPARARDRRDGWTPTSCSPALPGRGRRCWREGCRRSCRRFPFGILEVTRIHSVAGMLNPDRPARSRRGRSARLTTTWWPRW